MSSRCALRITEQGEAGPPAFTALLGRERVVAALGERRCARSRAWGACGAPLRPRFGLVCLELTSMHPLCCTKRVHERHESPFFGQILTLVYTFLGEALCGFESLARCRKKPESGDRHGLRASMAEREGFEAPLHAAVRCGRSHGFARFAGIRSAFPQLCTFAGFESLTCCRKSPRPKGTQARHSPWRRERDSNPRDAHAPNGFQDRRIQPLCHLSVVGNDSIEYRPA